MKKLLFGVLLISVFFTSGLIIPCTSFVVKGDRILYAMNFDFPDVEIKLLINENNGRKIFLMSFDNNGFYVPVAGMNSDGLFANLQMLFPEEELASQAEENEVFMSQIFTKSLNDFKTIRDILEYLRDKKVIQGNSTLHNAFADPQNGGVIVEAGASENMITKMGKDFIVMTNFPVWKFKDKSPENIEGSGADRYRIAYKNIEENIQTFDVAKAFQTLEKAKLEGENFSTLCSMVFDPIQQNIYIALKRNYNKIWKISLKDRVIETFQGFDVTHLRYVDSDGVLSSELSKF